MCISPIYKFIARFCALGNTCAFLGGLFLLSLLGSPHVLAQNSSVDEPAVSQAWLSVRDNKGQVRIRYLDPNDYGIDAKAGLDNLSAGAVAFDFRVASSRWSSAWATLLYIVGFSGVVSCLNYVYYRRKILLSQAGDNQSSQSSLKTDLAKLGLSNVSALTDDQELTSGSAKLVNTVAIKCVNNNEVGAKSEEVSNDKKSFASEPNKHHILLVDDDPVNRMVIDALLVSKSYRVTQCASGQEALDILFGDDPAMSVHDVDLVLLDVMMPGISGYEVCRMIRERYTMNQLPVLFLTGNTQVDDLKAGYAAGGNDFLTKPAAKDELFARMTTNLTLTKTHRQLESANAKLQQISTTDELTQIYNRKYFNEQLHKEWSVASRRQTLVSILLCDIDLFKRFNDDHGHLCGDACLRHAGRILKDHVRRTGDFVARYGGEEFGIVYLGTSGEQALVLADKLRVKFEQSTLAWGGLELGVTISIGVSSTVPSRGSLISEAIDRADKALYLAKRTGRNRCELSNTRAEVA
ncbi:MAG: hypothetical protein COA42_11140 [Alteromonadaceae bacterium]|nr:MAG: hypothetical protein COA42_11140 [Alteromonadaceae bacterium]